MTREGGPKKAKIQYGVKPDIFKIAGTVDPMLLDSLTEDSCGSNIERLINAVLEVLSFVGVRWRTSSDDEAVEWERCFIPRLSLTSLRIMLLNVTGLLIARTFKGDRE